MSFFQSSHGGFGHPARAPGFGTTLDAFAGISQNRGGDGDDDAIDFEDTYDGLGDNLDEADDNLNDTTFGGGDTNTQPPARDFDFFGSTSKVSGAINEEAIRFQRQNNFSSQAPLATNTSAPPPKAYKSGYEIYKKPGYVPDLQVDPNLWASSPAPGVQSGTSMAPPLAQKPTAPPQKKMMRLEEVEASMRAQPKAPSPAPMLQQQYEQHQSQPFKPAAKQPSSSRDDKSLHDSSAPPMRILQHSQHQPPRPQGQSSTLQLAPQQRPESQPDHRTQELLSSAPGEIHRREPLTGAPTTQILQHCAPAAQPPNENVGPQQPRQILQNPKRHSGQLSHPPIDPSAPVIRAQKMMMASRNGSQVPLPIITHPSQIASLSEEQRQAFMAEDAKRAKRNHKIFLLSKGNGLMTPQDKNFITRIQLQQLLTATGSIHDQDPDASLSEDFYYQVYNQIENRPRQHPHQPLSNFAQTYLFQTGSRRQGTYRRHNRGDNHMHRMQQQVQRAVEAAKAKPKNKQLVIEGSLGKISFSNAKTPKPLLNIKPNDRLPQATLNTTDRKAILKNIEAVYASLMAIEDHDRHIPQDPYNEHDPATAEPFVQWRQKFKNLSQRLWFNLKVMEPITPESTVMHPFIAFLSYPKGKKAIPRVISHIDQEQRLTVLTIIMVQLDTLDVIRSIQPQAAAKQSPITAREQIDLFLQTVMPSLFSYVTEAPLDIIIGLVGLVIERVNVAAVVRSQVGLEILTMLLSQAEIIRKSEATNEQEWEQWIGVFNRLFDTIEPLLTGIFPSPVNVSQDVYVWQFLATVGTGANPEQQQRLVLAVKDRVMDTIQYCKTLPADMAAQRRSDVNLFMQAIGLDVDLLDG